MFCGAVPRCLSPLVPAFAPERGLQEFLRRYSAELRQRACHSAASINPATFRIDDISFMPAPPSCASFLLPVGFYQVEVQIPVLKSPNFSFIYIVSPGIVSRGLCMVFVLSYGQTIKNSNWVGAGVFRDEAQWYWTRMGEFITLVCLLRSLKQ